MVTTWSQKIHSIEMCLRPCRFSVENFSALAGLEVKLGQTWSQHGPDMVPNNRDSMAIDLGSVNSVLKISEL